MVVYLFPGFIWYCTSSTQVKQVTSIKRTFEPSMLSCLLPAAASKEVRLRMGSHEAMGGLARTESVINPNRTALLRCLVSNRIFMCLNTKG